MGCYSGFNRHNSGFGRVSVTHVKVNFRCRAESSKILKFRPVGILIPRDAMRIGWYIDVSYMDTQPAISSTVSHTI
jgi:hypothetical protein